MRTASPNAIVLAFLFSAVAVCTTAQIPPISEQTRAGLDRVLSAKGTYVSEESAYKFSFPRTDLSLRIGPQQLSPVQSPASWVTFSPSMHRPGMVNGELVLLDDEVNPVITVVLKSGLEVSRNRCKPACGLTTFEPSFDRGSAKVRTFRF